MNTEHFTMIASALGTRYRVEKLLHELGVEPATGSA